MIVNGSSFIGDIPSKYRNKTLYCVDDIDCIVECSSLKSCYNATIHCPLNSSCTVLCEKLDYVCHYLDIKWTAGNNNLLQCSQLGCNNVPYPPPINHSTPYTINCDTYKECRGTIITCPDNAPCDIICSARYSCSISIIKCPTTAPCNIQVFMHVTAQVFSGHQIPSFPI